MALKYLLDLSDIYITLQNKSMTVLIIENTARKMAKLVIDDFITCNTNKHYIKYDYQGNIHGNLEEIFLHSGIYGFLVTKNGKSAIIYIGKAEGGSRLRQHLTGKNKNGSTIANSVLNKHIEI